MYDQKNWKYVTDPYAHRVIDASSPKVERTEGFTLPSRPLPAVPSQPALVYNDPKLSYDEALWVTIVGQTGEHALYVVKALRLYGPVQAIALPQEDEANYFHVQFLSPPHREAALQTARSRFFLVGGEICILSVIPCIDIPYATEHRWGIGKKESMFEHTESPEHLWPYQVTWIYRFNMVFRMVVRTILLLFSIVWHWIRYGASLLIERAHTREFREKAYESMQSYGNAVKESASEKINQASAGIRGKSRGFLVGISEKITASVHTQIERVKALDVVGTVKGASQNIHSKIRARAASGVERVSQSVTKTVEGLKNRAKSAAVVVLGVACAPASKFTFIDFREKTIDIALGVARCIKSPFSAAREILANITLKSIDRAKSIVQSLQSILSPCSVCELVKSRCATRVRSLECFREFIGTVTASIRAFPNKLSASSLGAMRSVTGAITHRCQGFLERIAVYVTTVKENLHDDRPKLEAYARKNVEMLTALREKLVEYPLSRVRVVQASISLEAFRETIQRSLAKCAQPLVGVYHKAQSAISGFSLEPAKKYKGAIRSAIAQPLIGRFNRGRTLYETFPSVSFDSLKKSLGEIRCAITQPFQRVFESLRMKITVDFPQLLQASLETVKESIRQSSQVLFNRTHALYSKIPDSVKKSLQSIGDVIAQTYHLIFSL